MKIALISSTLVEARAGGVPTYVEGRALHLSRKSKVFVYAIGNSGVTKNINSNLRVTALGKLGKSKLLYFVYWARLIARIAFIDKPDYIEIHNIPVGLAVSFFCRYTYFFHGPALLEAWVSKKTRRRALYPIILIERFVLARAHKINTASQHFQDLLSVYSYFSLRRGGVVKRPRIAVTSYKDYVNYEDHKHDAWRSCRGVGDKDTLKLCCIRRLYARTGVFELVQAMHLAMKRTDHLNVELIIAGNGPEQDRINKYVETNGLGSAIKIMGYISEGEKAMLYVSSDWNIVPTQYLEGFGLVVLEAAMMGCPSLATDVGALPETIALLGNHGKICKKDVESISDAIIALKHTNEVSRRNVIGSSKKFSISRKT